MKTANSAASISFFMGKSPIGTPETRSTRGLACHITKANEDTSKSKAGHEPANAETALRQMLPSMLSFSMQELPPLLVRDGRRRRIVRAFCAGVLIYLAIGVWVYLAEGVWVYGLKFLLGCLLCGLIMLPFDYAFDRAAAKWDRRIRIKKGPTSWIKKTGIGLLCRQSSI